MANTPVITYGPSRGRAEPIREVGVEVRDQRAMRQPGGVICYRDWLGLLTAATRHNYRGE